MYLWFDWIKEFETDFKVNIISSDYVVSLQIKAERFRVCKATTITVRTARWSNGRAE